MVKNSPANAGDRGSIPGQEDLTGQISLQTTTREKPTYHSVLPLRPNTAKSKYIFKRRIDTWVSAQSGSESLGMQDKDTSFTGSGYSMHMLSNQR